MKLVKGSIRTNKVGSVCEFEFEVEDGDTDEEIEEIARDMAFSYIEWNYEVQEKQSWLTN